MKIVKLIGFLILLSSCNNKYFGTVEPDYIPQNEIKEVFLNEIRVSDNNELKIKKVLYPLNKKFDFNESFDFQKVTSVDKNSKFLIFEDEIYYNKKNILYSININNFQETNNIAIEIDKDELIILITAYNKNIYILTSKGKIFKSLQNNFELINDLGIFLSQNSINNSSKITAFSIFGEVIEIDLNNNTFAITGNFLINHGVTTTSNIYTYDNKNLILYNSGTLIFLSQQNNSPHQNFYIEDLNILSQLGTFGDFIDAPFNINNFIYFIEKKGFISVFNPVNSKILWEIDISSPINDYFIDEDKNLFVLTYNKIYVFSHEGYLKKEIRHDQENPLNFWTDSENLYVANQNGLSIMNLNGEIINFIKQDFSDFLRIFNEDKKYYFLDSKNLYTISE